MATKKKVEDIEKPVAEKKPVAKKVAKKTAEKVVSEEKPAAKKVVAKVAKKPTATVEKVAAKAAPAKKTAKAKAVDKAEAPAKTAKATKTTSKVSEKTAKSVAAAKKVVKAATKAKKVDVEVVETPAAKKAAKTTPEALPQSFDPEYLVLMQKDPNWMQAFWEVSEERVKAAKKGKGKLVLRLFDIANDLTVKRNKKLKFHDIVVPEDARNWYIEKKSTQNCAAALGGRTNLNRFGQNYFGNEAMIEEATMLPKRFLSEDDDMNDE